MKICHVRNLFLALLVLAVVAPLSLKAQDEAADAKTDAEPKQEDSAPLSVEDEWTKLADRKAEIIARMSAIDAEFKYAVPSQKQTLADEKRALLKEFGTKLSPRMIELAGDLYEKDNKNVVAGEMFLNKLFDEQNYAKAVEVGDKLLAAGNSTPFVQNVCGIAHYATHDFAGAIEVFEAAKKAGNLDPGMGASYLKYAPKYVEFWPKEQEIRKAEEAAPDAEKNPRVLMKTSAGEIELELFENEAPNTVANFIELTEKKLYDGLKFHRVLPHFMIQGGDPNSANADPYDDGQGGPGHTIKCECYGDNARMHFAGSLSMAHAGRDSGGSQFFITHLPTAHLNRGMTVRNGDPHTCFGRVVKGMDVVAKIKAKDTLTSVTVLRKRDHDYVAVKKADAKPEPKPGKTK